MIMVPRVRTLRLPACTPFYTPGPLARETMRSRAGFAARSRAREAGLRQAQRIYALGPSGWQNIHPSLIVAGCGEQYWGRNIDIRRPRTFWCSSFVARHSSAQRPDGALDVRVVSDAHPSVKLHEFLVLGTNVGGTAENVLRL